MPKMVANRDVRVASLTGHVILFKEGVVTPVARSAVEDCLKVGVILAPGETLDEVKIDQAVPGGAERLDKIKEATRIIIARNERDDFGSAGRPTARAVDTRCGFKTDGGERDLCWSALKYDEQQRRDREVLRRQKPGDQDALFEAIATVVDALVERASEDDFTRDGEPHVKAIEEFLGYAIAHEERDEVWKRYQARSETTLDENTEEALDATDVPDAPPKVVKKTKAKPKAAA